MTQFMRHRLYPLLVVIVMMGCQRPMEHGHMSWIADAMDNRQAGGWSFNEMTGNTCQGLAASQNGLLQGAIKRVAGVRGGALEFTGEKSGMEVSHFNCDFRDGFTIMFWVKAPPERKVNRTILSFGAPGTPGYFRVLITWTGFIRIAFNGQKPVGCGAVDDDRWHHVALTWNGVALKLYLDDLDEGGPAYVFEDIADKIQQISGRLSPAAGTLRIGAMPDGSEPMRGTLDELKIYNRELGKRQILADYRAGRQPAEAHPVSRVARDPLIVDPIWKSCKDGCLMYNPKQKNWWYFFMQIRTFSLKEDGDDVSNHYGTKIGVSVSEDGVHWQYRGTLKGLDRHPGLNTFWAPDIFWDEQTGKFHAFITYIQGVHRNWTDFETINHYVSDDLTNWTYRRGYNFTSQNIDCTVHRLPNGKWGLWFKDQEHNQTGFAQGDDLDNLEYVGALRTDKMAMLEGAEVFQWNGYYWLIGDDCCDYPGIAVFRSVDGYAWTRCTDIFKNDPITYPNYSTAHHPEVTVVNDKTAYIFYWIGNGGDRSPRASVQYGETNVRHLFFENNELRVDRENENFELKLPGSSAANPDQGDLQSLINDAIASKARVLRIPPGEYCVAAPDLNGPHLKFMDASDLKIDARGVRLICQSPSQGILFYHCRNISLSGLTLDYEPLPLTQGVITAIAPDRSWTEVRIDEGYPDPILNTPGQAFYWTYDAQTRLLKAGASNRVAQAIVCQGGRIFRIDHGTLRFDDTAAPGDLLRMPQKFTSAHGMQLISCEGVRFTEVTVHSCYGFGIIAEGCSGNIFERVRIVPGPTPPGATRPRLFSSMFDGLHSLNDRIGPIIKDCEFDGTGDDAIAIYSLTGLVRGPANSASVEVATTDHHFAPLPGDTLRFYRFADRTIHERKLLASVARSNVDTTAIEQLKHKYLKWTMPGLDRDARTLTLDAPIELGEGDAVENRSRSGRGFRLTGNRIRNAGSRGIVVNQSNGVVANNRIEHTYMPGIHVFSFMRESGAGFQENIDIHDNRIVRANVGRCIDGRSSGAISIVSWDPDFFTANGHHGIRIADNTIEDADGLQLQLHCVNGAKVERNIFLRSHQTALQPWGERKIDPQATIYCDYARDIVLRDNQSRTPGPHADRDQPVRKTSETANIDGTVEIIQ